MVSIPAPPPELYMLGAVVLLGVVGSMLSRRGAENRAVSHRERLEEARALVREDEMKKIEDRIDLHIRINRDAGIGAEVRINARGYIEVTVSTHTMNAVLTRDNAIDHIGAITGWRDEDFYLTQGVHSWTAEKRER